MIGLLILIVVVVGIFVGTYKQESYNNEKRNTSQGQGEAYYTDYNGSTRRVDNNHKVLCNMHDSINGDRVDIDMKTGEYLNRVPDSDRVRKEKWIEQCKECDSRAKAKAIEEGIPFYRATVQVDDASKYNMFPGKEIYLRVSDDLPLDSKYPMQEVDYIDERTGIHLSKRILVMRDYNLNLYVPFGEDDYSFPPSLHFQDV